MQSGAGDAKELGTDKFSDEKAGQDVKQTKVVKVSKLKLAAFFRTVRGDTLESFLDDKTLNHFAYVSKTTIVRADNEYYRRALAALKRFAFDPKIAGISLVHPSSRQVNN